MACSHPPAHAVPYRGGATSPSSRHCSSAFLMMPLCALSVDVARWYVEVQRIQNAADAAATAGVTYLPDDFAAAQSTAIAVAARNGFPNGGTLQRRGGGR